MSVAGPSRLRTGRHGLPQERAESAYEKELLGLLDQLSVDDMDAMETRFARRASTGALLSDHDVAMNDLLQQAKELAVINEDRAWALQTEIEPGSEGVVGGSQVWASQPAQAPEIAATQPATAARSENWDGMLSRRYSDRVGNDTQPIKKWKRVLRSIVRVGRELFSIPVSGHPTTTDTIVTPSTNQFVPPKATSRATNTIVTSSTNRPTGHRYVTNATVTPSTNRPTGHDCVICQDPIRGAEICAPCGHYYDVGCVTDLFQSATLDETLYPPRCCRQNIPFARVRPHLSRELVTTFQQKEAEYSTLKRVYCSSPTCSRFLGPLAEGSISPSAVFTCPAPECGRRTCAHCRGPHDTWTHVCRPNADDTQVLELGRNLGWARCPGCSQMIELNFGCFHMTCRCRTEFCYLCRARWKTCQCPQWDEQRLLAAAEERVDAQLGRRPHVQRDQFDAIFLAPLGTRSAERPVSLGVSVSVPPATTRQPQYAKPRPPALKKSVSSASTLTPARASSSTLTSSVLRNSFTPTSSRNTSRPKSTHDPTDTMRQQLVRQMMERLRVDHDCDHGRWQYRRGGGVCQMCYDHLPLYLFRCLGCEMLVCRRCRHNRL